ncbi:MAG: toprim domain-containing protein [Cytophagales bacterium]|nr:toprim domain-containing protein [Cytophagales bacterium]MDW8385205.1 toprim domain-containing protein [Flammeovirgaceae bacterium]
MNEKAPIYNEESIKSLDPREHIRLRPGMYIGKLGDGSSPDDGIYVLVKEIIDNSVDEYTMGYGKKIEIIVTDHRVIVRDYGRGIPLGKVVDCVSKINTGAKYDSSAFQKSVGLNGVGTKAVNALSTYFKVQSFRDGETKIAEFEQGKLVYESPILPTKEKNGTFIEFEPDNAIFKHFRFNHEFLSKQIWNYAHLNAGLTLVFNNKEYFSQNGLRDLLEKNTDATNLRYPIIHLKGNDIEIAVTHTDEYGEEYFSFVNGQHTTQGGTHLVAFREALVKTIREFYKKEYAPEDVRRGIAAAIAIRIQEPVFESQTKTKLGSTHMAPNGITVRSFIHEFIKKELDNYLHKHASVAESLKKRIEESEKERKAELDLRKGAKEREKKTDRYNDKLRDCKIHLTDEKHPKRFDTTIFITEGDSASGSITKSRNPETQAVFSLRGKPLNCFNLTKKVVYENDEFYKLHKALGLEEGIEGLRYNKIVIATDADVDGMHIRLLLLTFFLQFFPEVVRNNHVYILETPLFRVRNPKNHKETFYCYSEEEKQQAIHALQKTGKKFEITRFKGLGEISADEFAHFIGENIRLEPVILKQETSIKNLLSYYMGKNTPERQQFIIENLRVEKDLVEELI